MNNLIDKIKNKLEEYDIPIYEHHKANDEDVLLVEDMMLVIKEKDNNLCVAFQATSKPELVASNILILKEISEIEYIDIMESFVFNNEHKIICGDEAFKLVYDATEQDIIQSFERERHYKMILISAKGYEC